MNLKGAIIVGGSSWIVKKRIAGKGKSGKQK